MPATRYDELLQRQPNHKNKEFNSQVLKLNILDDADASSVFWRHDSVDWLALQVVENGRFVHSGTHAHDKTSVITCISFNTCWRFNVLRLSKPVRVKVRLLGQPSGPSM